MKPLIYLLFSLYVLLLSVLPCADGSLDLRSDERAVQITADGHTHTDHSSDSDYCSPFCVCACCGTVATQPPVYHFTFLAPVVLTDGVSDKLSQTLLLVALSAWQPPQIS